MTETPPDLALVSVVVPAYQADEDLPHCLAALREDGGSELDILVVDDASPSSDVAAIAERFGARWLRLEENGGPAVARNEGVKACDRPYLMFIDADVVVHPGTIRQALAALLADDTLGACFGSYDETPADPGFFSQYRNLYHRWVHQQSPERVSTFWTGCGGMRRSAYDAANGFNPQLSRSGMEDIEIGYRITDAGYRIRILKNMLCQHRKRWTLGSTVRTDIFHRGVPWMLILLAREDGKEDLNINQKGRAATVAGGLFPGLLVLGALWPPALWGALACAVLMVGVQWGFYRYVTRIRSAGFALRVMPAQWLFFLCCAVSIPIAVLQQLTGRGLKPR